MHNKEGKSSKSHRIEQSKRIGFYLLLKGRCNLTFEVIKVRAKNNHIVAPDEVFQVTYNNDRVYHGGGDGGEEDLEVELNDGAYTEERIASPSPELRDRIDDTQDS